MQSHFYFLLRRQIRFISASAKMKIKAQELTALNNNLMQTNTQLTNQIFFGLLLHRLLNLDRYLEICLL